MNLKEADALLDEWYPKTFHSITIDFNSFGNGNKELEYQIYISGDPKIFATSDSLENAMAKVKPNTLSIEEQFEDVEKVLEDV